MRWPKTKRFDRKSNDLNHMGKPLVRPYSISIKRWNQSHSFVSNKRQRHSCIIHPVVVAVSQHGKHADVG